MKTNKEIFYDNCHTQAKVQKAELIDLSTKLQKEISKVWKENQVTDTLKQATCLTAMLQFAVDEVLEVFDKSVAYSDKEDIPSEIEEAILVLHELTQSIEKAAKIMCEVLVVGVVKLSSVTLKDYKEAAENLSQKLTNGEIEPQYVKSAKENLASIEKDIQQQEEKNANRETS